MTTIERVAFDTNALIYFVERTPRYCDWLDPLFASIQEGRCIGVVSVISEAETRVKPLRDGNLDRLRLFTAIFETPGVEVVEVTRALAMEATRVRAQTRLDLPDSIIVATAVAAGCDALIGNDAAFAKRVTQLPYVYLEDAIGR